MKRRCRFASVLMTVIGLLSVRSGFAAGPSNAEPAWEFVQENRTFGVATCQVSKNSVVVKRNDGTVYVLAGSPPVVTCYSTKSKLRYDVPLSKWQAGMACSFELFSGDFMQLEKWTKKSTSKNSQGLNVSEYALHSKKFRSGRCVMAQTESRPECSTFLTRLFGIPQLSGIPLDLDFVTKHGFFKSHLATTKIKKIEMAKDACAIPPFCKKSKSEQEVNFSSSENAGIIEDLAR